MCKLSLKWLIAVPLFLSATLPVYSQDRTKTITNTAGIYDNLYDIYRESARFKNSETVLHLADSMRNLAIAQNDKRAIAMSYAYPLVFYMNKKDEEKFLEETRQMMKASEEAELWSFYYYAISQHSIYLLRGDRVGEALDLAQRTMTKAYAENNANGIYTSHSICVNCFTNLGLYDLAIKEAEKAIEAEIGLPDNDFGTSVSKLLDLYYRKRDWKMLLETAVKYEGQVVNRSAMVRLFQYKTIANFWLGNTDEYHRCRDEAEELVKTTGESTTKELSRAMDAIRLFDEGRVNDAADVIKDMGRPDYYYYAFDYFKRRGRLDSMQKTMDQFALHLYEQHEQIYNADIMKLGLELENKDLELENKELEFRRRQALIGGTAAVILILLIAGLIILMNIRKSNRKLKSANDVLVEQKKRLEQSIEEVRKADSENEAKTSFLFNMSHDIRTPMNAIIGFRDMLEKYQDDPVKRADYLSKIGESSRVLLSIINNVLEMSRIEKGTVVISEEPFDTGQFFDSLCVSFEDMMRHKGITFTKRMDITHRYACGDTTKLREIFDNILSNAYKYTGSGGKVEISLEELPGNEDGFATYLTTVSDTGSGMSEEFLPHLFEEFAREDTSTANKIEGTGLGMSIVKRLVELQNGTIETESHKGVGTTFRVKIPHRISESAPVLHTDVEISPDQFRGKRILLAEDNDLNAEIAVDILGEFGILTDRAEDGLQAVEMLGSVPAGTYSLVLMDVQMPHMDGYEATKVIRSLTDSAKASVPIVAMTANAFEEDRRNAVKSGMNYHLAKPIDIDELVNVLARFVS